MKRFKFYLCLLLVIGIAAGLWWLFADDAGYILISANSFRYESTLLLVVLVFIALALCWWLFKLIFRLLGSSFAWLNPWSSNKKMLKNNLSLEQGVIAFCSDDFAAASNNLSKGASLVHQLLLVKSLINEHKYNEALNNLKPLTKNPNSKLISSVLYNQILLKQNNKEALNNIRELFKQHKREFGVIHLLVKALMQNHNYDEAFNLVIKNKLNIDLREFNLIWRNFIAELNTNNLLISNWHKLPSFYSSDANVIASYALRLQQLGDASSAEQIVRKSLKKDYQTKLVYIYGEIKANLDAQFKFAQSLLAKNKNDHNLYLTLAKLNLAQNLYEKSYEYLMLSINVQKSDEAQKLLAAVMLKLGNNSQAINLLTQNVSAD